MLVPFALTLVACSDAPPTLAPEDSLGAPSSTAVLWNGFQHLWSYNHRVNVLGSGVEPVVCDDVVCDSAVVHAAASGSGSDEAKWTGLYSTLQAPGARFVGGATVIPIEAADAEGDALVLEAEAFVPEMTGYGVALLNGFELLALSDADKLAELSIAVGEPAPAEGGATVPISVSLRMDCDSVECDGTLQRDDDVAYTLRVGWLYGEGDVALTAATVDDAYSWDNRRLTDEISFVDRTVEGSVVGRGGAAAALGLTGLHVELDDDHHMAEWSTWVRPQGYDPAAGTQAFDGVLAFKQWNVGTWWNPVAYTEAGSAAIGLDLALLEVSEGCASSGVAGGSIRWRADGGGADGNATDRRPVRIPANCP